MTPARGEPEPLLTLGRCDEMRAEVFFTATAAAAATQARLTGSLTGPRRGRDVTLPSTSRLEPLPRVDGHRGATARCVLTEPAYWSPELPNLYRLEARLEADGREVHTGFEMLVGLRRLGTRGRSLWLEGRRWVPRGVTVASGFDPVAHRREGLMALLADPDAAALAEADSVGVAVAALAATSDEADLVGRIGAWARHPAVVLAILPMVSTAAALATAGGTVKGTMLLGQAVAGAEPPPAACPGVDVLVVLLDAGATPHEGWRAGAPVPLLAWRADRVAAGGRRGCDALQQDLAAWGLAAGIDRLPWDWAGYAVGPRPAGTMTA